MYFNFFIQTSYLENERNLITNNSNTMHFNFSILLECFVQSQGKCLNKVTRRILFYEFFIIALYLMIYLVGEWLNK